MPSLHGRRVYLRAPIPDDYPDLYLRETSSDRSALGGLAGSTPPYEEWLRARSAGVLCQHIALTTAANTRLGLVTAFGADFANGHAHLAALSFAPERPRPMFLIGLGIFIDYVFGCWAFHKLYLDVVEPNYAQFASGAGQVFEVEGRLKDHHYLGGRRWDQIILAIHRSRWSEFSARWLGGERA